MQTNYVKVTNIPLAPFQRATQLDGDGKAPATQQTLNSLKVDIEAARRSQTSATKILTSLIQARDKIRDILRSESSQSQTFNATGSPSVPGPYAYMTTHNVVGVHNNPANFGGPLQPSVNSSINHDDNELNLDPVDETTPSDGYAPAMSNDTDNEVEHGLEAPLGTAFPTHPTPSPSSGASAAAGPAHTRDARTTRSGQRIVRQGPSLQQEIIRKNQRRCQHNKAMTRSFQPIFVWQGRYVSRTPPRCPQNLADLQSWGREESSNFLRYYGIQAAQNQSLDNLRKRILQVLTKST